MRKALLPILLSIAFLLALTGIESPSPNSGFPRSGIAAHALADDDLFELRKNFEIFGAMYEEIVMGYVDRVRPQPFMKTGVDAMLAELDPYTRFYDQADNMDIAQMRRGPEATVGLNIGMQSGQLTVLAPEGLTSGYHQGVRVGDRILRVDGVDVSKITVRDVVVLLRGENNTPVELEIERPDTGKILTFILRRETSKTTNVSFSGYLEGDSTLGIGYVRLDAFGNRAAREVRRAFRSMLRSGGLHAAVLDLRNNPGGLVSEAVGMVELFVPRGTMVVSVQGRHKDSSRNYMTEEEPFMPDIPLVILVNRFSASSSEIVSGALQDLDRAIIMGETTFGKGLVQIGRKLPYNTSMRITIGHYFTPGGRDIQSRRITSSSAEISRPSVEQYRTTAGRPVRSGVGIEPDVDVTPDDPGELQQALRQDGAFFLFAGEWINKVPSDALHRTDTELFNSFRAWLRARGFRYTTRTEEKLAAVSDVLPDHWDADLKGRLNDIQLAMEEEKEVEFSRIKSAILKELREEIMSRILDRKALIEYELQHDETVGEALDLLRDLERYRSLLTQ